MPDAASAARGVYTPRRPQASPLFRLVSDHLHRLQTVYDERFVREYGPRRPVVAQVTDKFLACGVLDHGFARIRCDACAHESLLAFSCECRYFCPSCHANWHPHLHLLVTDGGFRPDGTFVSWPAHDTARLTEAFRRAMLRLFVRLELFDEEQAAGMLSWPHSGFHVHTAVWVPEDDRAFATRLARYCARNPVALERLTYDRSAMVVTYRSDKSEGPTVGTETVDPLEFLARVLVHIPDKGHVTTRNYGWYANRPRGMRRQAEPATANAPPVIVPPPRLAPTEASRRWAALLQQIFEVGPLACPSCHSPMRIVAFITQASVIDQILAHLRARLAPAAHTGARSPPPARGAPHRRGPPRAGARHAPHARSLPPRRPHEVAPPPDAPRPRGDVRRARRPCKTQGTPPPVRGAGEVRDRAVRSTSSRPTPIEIPIPTRHTSHGRAKGARLQHGAHRRDHSRRDAERAQPDRESWLRARRGDWRTELRRHAVDARLALDEGALLGRERRLALERDRRPVACSCYGFARRQIE